MATPIQPSLAQMLQTPTAPAGRPAAPATPQTAQAMGQAGGFANALAAQKAFFQQISAPKVTPPTYTAADIEKATQRVTEARSVAPPPSAADETQPPKRPGSYLNIVI